MFYYNIINYINLFQIQNIEIRNCALNNLQNDRQGDYF